MRHADRDRVELLLGGTCDDCVEEGDHRLGALEAEALLPDVLGLQEGLEGLGLVELAEDAHLLVVRGLDVRHLEVRLQPLALSGVGDVHVLDADGAAVGVAQHAEDVAQQSLALAAEAADDELAVEIPEAESVMLDLEVGVRTLHVLERVDVGHQVAVRAVGVDQLADTGLLRELGRRVDRDVGRPQDRLVRNAEVSEDLAVEVLLADQQLVHDLEELAASGSLDDAVVIGGGEGDRLADAGFDEASRATSP